jgi:general secretion pathway protein A
MSLLPLRANAVLIIDEAQNLPLRVLEQVRILSNLETDKEKLLQIVLVGQLNLRDQLRAPELRQLDQRVSIRYELKPLTRAETSAYIGHRLAIAGGGAVVQFAPKALELVHRFTGGIPRLINLLCDRALLGGYSARTNKISGEMIEAAAHTLELAPVRRSIFGWTPSFAWTARRGVAMTAAAAAVAAAAGSGAMLLQARSTAPRGDATSQQIASAVEPPRPVPAEAPTVEAPTGAAPAAAAEEQKPAQADPGPLPAPQSPQGTAGSDPPAPVKNDDAAPEAGKYSVQVGSFRQETEAERLTRQLSASGYRARMLRVNGVRGVWHQVLVGPYADVDSARQDQLRVRELPGYGDARLVIH